MTKKKINSKQKGKKGELEVVHFLQKHGFDARRGVQYEGGPNSPDIVSEDLDSFHIEVKRTQKTDIYGWLEQVLGDNPNKVPLILHRKNDQEWVSILRLTDLLDLLFKVIKE